jgi:hypothetical protein
MPPSSWIPARCRVRDDGCGGRVWDDKMWRELRGSKSEGRAKNDESFVRPSVHRAPLSSYRPPSRYPVNHRTLTICLR